jgi:hypothetical protein
MATEQPLDCFDRLLAESKEDWLCTRRPFLYPQLHRSHQLSLIDAAAFFTRVQLASFSSGKFGGT